MLSILLAHGLEMAFGFRVEGGHTLIGHAVTGSDQNLLIFRALMFSLSPLMFAWLYLKLSKKKIDRDTLRAPFFAQCYLSGATSIAVSLASLSIRDPRLWTTVAGVVVLIAATIWYLAIQHLWLMQVAGVGRVRAWAWATATFGAASGLVAGASLLAM